MTKEAADRRGWTRVSLGAAAAGALLAGAATPPPAAGRVSFEWQVVCDLHNPADPVFTFGRVDSGYEIARYEVTNEQYAAFLDAVAALGDPYALYHPSMASDSRGGIVRQGGGTIADPYVHLVKPFLEDKPVNYVSFFDAARFANWLHNGQGDGDTETGAYALLGTNPMHVLREPDATHFLPSEDEWFKAAYYDPSVGPSHYYGYPTRSNAAPVPAAADRTGDASNPGTNVANYLSGADWKLVDGNVTTVGSIGPLAESYYGCADMGGNVREWTDSIFVFQGMPLRLVRGGMMVDVAAWLHKSGRLAFGPEGWGPYTGFRVARRKDPPGLAGTASCP